MDKTLLSAVQPSSRITLGNYLGTMKRWNRMQDKFDCLFMVADLHSITVPQNSHSMLDDTYYTVASYLSVGVDPSKSRIFIQSHVPQHAGLSWILTCFSTMGELSRMTQYKDKSGPDVSIGTGLISYPILMASDILLYQTNFVPVGDDQCQHLQLARDLAQRMNHKVDKHLFTVPTALVSEFGSRVMSLQDPTRKMSKSDPTPGASIFLADSNDVIVKKIRRAVTDSRTEISEDVYGPGVNNLLEIHASLSGGSMENSMERFRGYSYGYLKDVVSDMIVAELSPIRQSIVGLMNDKAHLHTILNFGSQNAQMRAEKTLHAVNKSLGFLPKL